MIAQFLRFGTALAFVLTSMQAWSADISQHKTVGGIDVYYGVVPAEVVRGHAKEHGAEPMHGKSSLSRGTHHLVVTLFDAKTAQRIADAKVTATVTPLGLSPEKKSLDVMKINDAVSYGNYFGMPPSDTPYKIELSIQRPGAHSAVTANFEYRHGNGFFRFRL